MADTGVCQASPHMTRQATGTAPTAGQSRRPFARNNRPQQTHQPRQEPQQRHTPKPWAVIAAWHAPNQVPCEQQAPSEGWVTSKSLVVSSTQKRLRRRQAVLHHHMWCTPQWHLLLSGRRHCMSSAASVLRLSEAKITPKPPRVSTESCYLGSSHRNQILAHVR